MFSIRGRSLSAGRLPVLLAVVCLCAPSGDATAQELPGNDRAVLEALYDATGGSSWVNNTGWLTDASLQDWYGIETDDEGRVTIVSLTRNGLIGQIPPRLGDLEKLEELWLTANELTGQIPPELGNLVNLEVLSLAVNRLSGSIPASLRSLARLEQLNLNGNTLEGTIPPALQNLSNVVDLSLNDNGLSGTIPPGLGNLSNLRWLSLGRNGLTGGVPGSLGDLVNLESLHLGNNAGLTGLLPLRLITLVYLKRLDIRNTDLCGPASPAFQAWAAAIDFQGCMTVSPPPPSPPGGGGGFGGGGFGGGGGGAPRTTVPSAPRNLTAVGGDGEVVLSWEAPEDNGGSAITDYEYRNVGKDPWTSTGSSDTTYTVSGLDNGTTYAFEVRAVNRVGKSFPSNRVEATPQAPQVFSLDFPHFANGGGITSDVVLLNVGTTAIRPVLYFSDRQGELLAPDSVVEVGGDLEVTEDGGLTLGTAVEPLAERTVSTHGRGDEVSGSVQAVADGAIGGVLRYRVPGVGVTGVGTGAAVGDALFPARRQQGGIRTAAALRNLGEEAIEVSCLLLSGGAVLEAAAIPLEANGQTSWFLEEVFLMSDTTDFTGTVRCTAPEEERFTGLAVEVDAANRIFTTLPVVAVGRPGGEGGETVLYFAHFANGGNADQQGIRSELVFVNRQTEPSRRAPTPFHRDIPASRPVISFYDRGGQKIDPATVVEVGGDLEITAEGALTIKTEMAPLGELTIATHGRGDEVSGSVQVVSEGAIGGVLRYRVPGVGVTGVGTGTAVGDALFPARRQQGGIRTAAALRNLGEEAIEVSCLLLSGGAVLEEAALPLAGHGQRSWFLEEVFTETDTTDFVGTVRCTAPEEERFTGLAVEVDAANRIFTTLPVVALEERTAQQ